MKRLPTNLNRFSFPVNFLSNTTRRRFRLLAILSIFGQTLTFLWLCCWQLIRSLKENFNQESDERGRGSFVVLVKSLSCQSPPSIEPSKTNERDLICSSVPVIFSLSQAIKGRISSELGKLYFSRVYPTL